MPPDHPIKGHVIFDQGTWWIVRRANLIDDAVAMLLERIDGTTGYCVRTVREADIALTPEAA